MRRYGILLIISCSLIFIFCNNAQPENWKVISYFLNVTDMDSDLNFIYASTSSGIIAIDKVTDEVKTVASFRKAMSDIPMQNLMADPYMAYNLYFTGRNYIYRFDWFNDTIYFCNVFKLTGKSVNRIGISEDSLFVIIGDSVYASGKHNMTDTGWVLRENRDNVIWDSDNKDFTKFPQLTPHKKYFNDKEYRYTAYVENFNDIYIGTDGAGILKINKFSKEEKQYIYGLGSLNARAMALDSSGSIWLGGANTINITRLNPEKTTSEFFRTDYYTAIPDNQLIYICASKKNILFLTEFGQAFYFSTEKNRFFPIDKERGTILFRAFPVDDSRFLVTNDLGVGIIDVDSREFTQLTDNLTSVINVEYFKDTVYLVSQNTLYKAKLGEASFSKVEFPFPTFIIYQYMKTDEAEILLDNAYIHIKLKGEEQFTSYPNNLFGEFYDMAFDGENCFITSLEGFGIFPLKTKRWKIYNKRNSPIPSSGFYNIIAHKGFLYLNSQNGLTRFYYTNPLLNE
ncbi:MAG: hypothetical protein AB7T10_08845 [bacterium]